MAGDIDGTMTIRKEAHDLAVRLNHGQPGILGGPDAPGCVLARDTAAPTGTVPKWGQTGDYEITVRAMRVRIVQHGIFGTGANFSYWPGFAAHAIDRDKPFLSETGYRSFIGAGVSKNNEMPTGLTPDECARIVIEDHVSRDLKGKLRKIVPFEEWGKLRQIAPPSP